jgi:hypothetical protein
MVLTVTVLFIAFLHKGNFGKRPFPETTVIAACVSVPLLYLRKGGYTVSHFIEYAYPLPDQFGLKHIQMSIIRFFMQFHEHRFTFPGGHFGFPFTWRLKSHDVAHALIDSTALLMNIAFLTFLVAITYRIERGYKERFDAKECGSGEVTPVPHGGKANWPNV